MDIQTPLICAGVVAFSAAVVYLTSILAIRERTYEEAIEEQRLRSSFDTNFKVNKIEKPKKDKKEKSAKKANKKLKAEKSSDCSDGKQLFELNNSDNNETQTPMIRKAEHNVEFKAEPEIVLLNNVDNVEVSSRYQKTISKPAKPILINKIEVQEVAILSSQKQRNSFDLIIPKDELELLKESKRLYETESSATFNSNDINEQNIATNEQTKSNNDFTLNRFSNSDQIETIEPEVNQEFILKTDVSNNLAQPQRKAKKSKTSHSSIDGNNKEFSAKVITNIIKSTSFTNEEIQLLTDALLNKQSDGSTEWRKKNDPMAMVKKQLQEKELALEAEMKNCEAAVLKNRELRQELATEKTKQLNNREKTQQMQQEVHNLQLKLQQNYDNQRSEVKSLQNQLQQLQVKINDDRNVIIQLKDENSRMQQLLKNDQHLKHEIEQLRNDRQQYEIRFNNTQKVNDDLLRKTQQYDTHIKTLSDKIQNDELSYQKLVNELKQELQKSESQCISLVDELNVANNNRSVFESDSIQLQNRLEEVERTKNEELARLLNDISELSREKELLEETNRQQSGEMLKEDNEKLNKLNDELNYTKEELRNIKNELENQIQKNEELKEKNRLAFESIENNERVKNECIENAVKAAQQLSNQKFMSELEIIRIENESRICDLNEAKNTLETYMQQILLVKEVLKNIFPSFDPNGDNWIEAFNCAFVEFKNQQQTNIVVLEQQLSQKNDETRDILKNERQKSSELEEKVTQYTKALSDTENILSNLQTKIEDKENVWKLEEQKYQNEIKKLTDDCNRLCDENEVIKSNLNQIDNLRATIEQMENQQKQLQSNIENELQLKKQLEIKFDEVNKDIVDLKDSLLQKNNEIEIFREEKHEIEALKHECEELRNIVEKERKISKELSTQNVRLNSLVKIGTESLKIEEEKVKQLEAQLNLNNGSLSVNCPAANGSSESIPSIAINTICDSNEEGASVKK